MTPPPAILGIDVGELVEDAVRALVDLIVPDAGADWVSRLVTWLVALPPVTGESFPALNRYADKLVAVGFGLLGACFIGGLLQLWAGGLVGATGGEALKRAAIAAGALVTYATVLESVLVGVNVLTAQMIRHPLVQDGLDKAFGEALTVAAVAGGLSLGLAIGAALVVLYFVAALFVLKIGLTALLSVAVIAGALVWGLYPLPQAAWLTRAWIGCLVSALVVPIAWACVFAAAALLAADTLVFDGGSRFNHPLGDALAYLVKPFAAVACFWIAYRAPFFLLGIARSAGLSGMVMPRATGGGRAGGGPSAMVTRGIQANADRFRALTHGTTPRVARATSTAATRRPATSSARTGLVAGRAAAAVKPPLAAARHANEWWRALPAQGARLRRGQHATQTGGTTEVSSRTASAAPARSASRAARTNQRIASPSPAPPHAAPRSPRGKVAAARTTTSTPIGKAMPPAARPAATPTLTRKPTTAGPAAHTAANRRAQTAPTRPTVPAARPMPPPPVARAVSGSAAGASPPRPAPPPTARPAVTPPRPPAAPNPAAAPTAKARPPHAAVPPHQAAPPEPSKPPTPYPPRRP